MSNSSLLRFGTLALLLAAGSRAAPFKLIGSGAELFLTGTVGVRADDNIFLTGDGESDLIFDLAPGVELQFGQNAQLRGTLTLREQFTSYADNSALNHNLFKGAFSTNFDDGKLKLRSHVRFEELNQNSFDVRPTLAGRTPGLVRRDVFNAGVDGEMEVSPQFLVGTGLSFYSDHYKRDGFSDVQGISVPIDLFYKYTQKTDISVGYRYRSTEVSRGIDTTEHFLGIGARGEFTPKLSGRFAVGLNRRTLERGGDDNQLGLDAAFNYELTPKTTLELGATNDFGTSPQGQSIRNTTLRAQAIARIAAEWSVLAGASWRAIDYGARTDDYYEITFGAAYVINAWARLTGGFAHRDYRSGARFAAFKNNVFSVSADFRY